MYLVHNESIFEALETTKDEIRNIKHDLDTAIDELKYALNTDDKENRDHYIRNATRFIRDAELKLYE